jgi:hypothetical protein
MRIAARDLSEQRLSLAESGLFDPSGGGAALLMLPARRVERSHSHHGGKEQVAKHCLFFLSPS